MRQVIFFEGYYNYGAKKRNDEIFTLTPAVVNWPSVRQSRSQYYIIFSRKTREIKSTGILR